MLIEDVKLMLMNLILKKINWLGGFAPSIQIEDL